MPSIESYQLLLAAAAACEDKKAEDIRILALDPGESGLSDYFLICNGTNERQNDAISDEIELRLKRDFGIYPNAVEGRRQAEWILLDYVDFIVHIFSPEKRAFYGLERLRKSAVTVSTDQLTAELRDAMEAQLAPKRRRQQAMSQKGEATEAPAPALAKKKAAAKKPKPAVPASLVKQPRQPKPNSPSKAAKPAKAAARKAKPATFPERVAAKANK